MGSSYSFKRKNNSSWFQDILIELIQLGYFQMSTLLRIIVHARRTLTLNGISKATWKKIDDYSKIAPTPLTIENFHKLCNVSHIQEYYDFLRYEILRRLAGMIKEMNNLPRDMSQISTVNHICSLYCSTFEDVLYFEERNDHTSENLDKLFKVIKVILDRHKHVLYSLACGMMEYKQRNQQLKTSEDMNAELIYYSFK
ncbi:hypothetical protein GJ496_011996 [Pomphorhynchus laevis]|nr:hypothetical protein GJ496_011996 [Pomphorhynchus laevis]